MDATQMDHAGSGQTLYPTLVTKRHLKAVNEKLDQQLSTSSSGAYSEAALKALFSSVVTEHSATLSFAAKAIESSTSQCHQASLAVDSSTKVCKEATAKVDKIVSEAHLFLDSLQAAATKNAQTVNALVESLQRSLQSKRSNLEVARQAIEAVNETLHANVNDRLNQLKAELVNYKLCTATAEVNDLKSEREVIRSSAADVHSILLPLITIRRHLADKLRPTLDILSRIEGFPVNCVQPKQGGEKMTTQPPSGTKPSTEPKGNEASVSNKDKKMKKIGEDDTDNEDDVYAENPKNPFQKVKPSEKEIKENYKKQKAELEQKQKEAELLEKKKSMFPIWTIDSLQRCAIDEPIILWLEPVMSFGIENSKDAQFHMPITRKTFIFHCFNLTAAIPSPDPKVDRDILEFYLEFAQPQYLTWSSKKITTLKFLKPYSAGKFINFKFKVTRGTEGSVHNITFADLPNLNPHDWILLNNIHLSNPQEYQPIIDHVKRILVYYIHEAAKIDQEIASAIHKRTTIKTMGRAGNVNTMVKGKIDSKYQTVMFIRGEGQKCLFALVDKYLFSTSCLEHILEIIQRCDQNSAAEKKSLIC
uniref:Uncharacterized protein n=1 Tax=Lactuca sativa TaxID=4236 RepID=A0A9R1WL10_LACSA|nr:hypothetical protein LSAT_V11C200061910 [Lactuca sativa]